MIGVGKGGQAACDGRVLITQTTFLTFRPKGLGLLYALMPPGETEHPPFQEISIVAKLKVCFGAFVCMYRCGLLVSFCLHLSGVDVNSQACQWLKYPTEY